MVLMTKDNNQNFDLIFYNKLLQYVDNTLLFENKTIKTWVQELTLPEIPEQVDVSDLTLLHITANKFSEIIYSNLAIAKIRLVGTKAALTKKTNVSEFDIREAISKDPNKKLPTASVVENRAFNNSLDEMHAQTVSEIFCEFWKTQAQKLDSFNNRLTTLSYTVNQENRLSMMSSS